MHALPCRTCTCRHLRYRDVSLCLMLAGMTAYMLCGTGVCNHQVGCIAEVLQQLWRFLALVHCPLLPKADCACFAAVRVRQLMCGPSTPLRAGMGGSCLRHAPPVSGGRHVALLACCAALVGCVPRPAAVLLSAFAGLLGAHFSGHCQSLQRCRPQICPALPCHNEFLFLHPMLQPQGGFSWLGFSLILLQPRMRIHRFAAAAVAGAQLPALSNYCQDHFLGAYGRCMAIGAVKVSLVALLPLAGVYWLEARARKLFLDARRRADSDSPPPVERQPPSSLVHWLSGSPTASL